MWCGASWAEHIRRVVMGLLKGGGIILASLVIAVILVTASSHYAGEPYGAYRYDRSVVEVAVSECGMVGPFSWSGIGYWSECTVILAHPSEGMVATTVGQSIVAASEVGATTELVMLCEGKEPFGQCALYSTSGNTFVAALIALLDWIVVLVLIGGFAIGLSSAVAAILGEKLYRKIFQTRRSRRNPEVVWPVSEDVKVLNRNVTSHGAAVVFIRFGYPEAVPWLAEKTVLLEVNGVKMGTNQWSTYEVAIPQGKAHISAGVHLSPGLASGSSTMTLSLKPGDTIMLDYIAPLQVNNPGNLGPRGEVSTAEFSQFKWILFLGAIGLVAYAVLAP